VSASRGADVPRSGTPGAPLRALAEELVRGGVREVVICPGSRSTPLALALRMQPGLRSWVHLDERAGAFFALGAAKASRRPVAILVTSGTAAAELLPAMVEAFHGRVPLIALTADRPPELRDRGAPQTIDQDHLFGRFAKWFADLPVPEPGEWSLANLRATVGRATSTAPAAPAGPVHLNLPFREPLVPVGDLVATGTGLGPHTMSVIGRSRLPGPAVDELAERLVAASRGLIVCGPGDTPGLPAAISELAACAGFPVIADGLSNLRFGPHDRSHVIARADALLRLPAFAEHHRPDLILRVGGTPTSKALLTWLDASDAEQLIVDEGGWNAPTLQPVTMIDADAVLVARDLVDRLAGRKPRGGWHLGWQAAEQAAGDAAADWLAQLDEPFEGQVPADLAASLPDGAILFVASSMPVRDLDAFSGSGRATVRCLGNRGANGIDGLLSTTLGIAAVSDGPVVALVGDLAFLHDLNALVAGRRLGVPATIVVVNNDGGGIFSFLPQATVEDPSVGLPEQFEALFGTPHGTDLGAVCRALGAEHVLVGSGEVGARVRAAAGEPGLRVLEVRTERRRNVELHREVHARMAEAVSAVVAAADLAGRGPGTRGRE
jgi:2-succinyl-5-enolpyruvyl-6-hydroxy-3-cyclohexene-1-carboxylate synthase